MNKQDYKDKYVIVGKKGKYITVISKPSSKTQADEIFSVFTENLASLGETGEIMSVEDVINHPNVIGKEYLKKGGRIVGLDDILKREKSERIFFIDKGRFNKSQYSVILTNDKQNYESFVAEFQTKKEALEFIKKYDGIVVEQEQYKKGGDIEDSRLNELISGYKQALLFSSIDNETGEAYDANYGVHDFSEKTDESIKNMLKKYISENKDAMDESGLDDEQIGMDIWYTQAGHGVGFFDRNLDKEIEDKLTKGAKSLADLPDTEIGDDEKIYIIGGRHGYFEKGGQVADHKCNCPFTTLFGFNPF